MTTMKPFAISPREQFTVLTFLLNTASENKDERAKRRALWEEIGVKQLKKKILRVQAPKAAGTPQPDPLTDPDGVYAWQYAEEDPTVRVELHQTTVSYLIEKLSGRLEGAIGEVMGELCERLISLRDTAAAATITTSAAGGYKLPRDLWSKEEIAADNASKAPRVAEDIASPA